MLKFLVVPLMLGLVIGPALAEDKHKDEQILTAITPDLLIDILRARGSSARIEDISSDQGFLNRMAVAGMAGSLVRFFFTDCRSGKDCATLQIRTVLENRTNLSASDLNRWNLIRPYTRAALDLRNQVVLAMDIGFFGGITRDAVSQSLNRYEILLGQFKAFAQSPPAQPQVREKPVPLGKT